MDYFEILKRAWKVTWKYKALWILGFFVGAGGGGGGYSSGGSNFSTGGGDTSAAGEALSDAWFKMESWVAEHIALVAVVAALLLVFGLVMWALGIAARGGLIHLVNEAEENRDVHLGKGWSVGFRFWGRNFMIGFLLGLPLLLIVLAMTVMIALPLIGAAGSSSDMAAAGGFTSVCCGVPLMMVVIFVAALFVSIITELAMRYAVLDDVTFGQSIARAWSDLWAKRGAWVMWLVMLLPGIAYGVIVAVVSLVFIVPAIFLVIAGKFLTAVALVVLVALVLMLPGAVYGTFVSSAWTIFFRRMTGKEIVVATGPAPATYAPAPPAPESGFAPAVPPVVIAPEPSADA
ncbi:MAG: hypothetical protein WBI63_07600 [Coriobacteriia bacterium]